MVVFKNIRVEGDYIYALVCDLDAKRECDVKLHTTNDEYKFNGEYTTCMVKALWSLQDELKDKKRIPKEHGVAWG